MSFSVGDSSSLVRQWIQDRRSLRFVLQQVSALILKSAGYKSGVSSCNRAPIPGRLVTLDVDTCGHASFSGLQQCGSVWVCPVCASKISERRRLELQKAIDNHRKSGGSVAMVTLTLRHDKFRSFSDLLRAMGKSRCYLKSGRKWEDFSRAQGVIGTIYSLEATWGELNGWHPHYHLLVFSSFPEIDLRALLDYYQSNWISSLKDQGFDALEGISVVVTSDRHSISSYVTKSGSISSSVDVPQGKKWTVSHEMAKSVVKAARGGRLTPFGILQAAASCLDAQDFDGFKKYSALWVDYFLASRGKRQLDWSEGLHSLLLPCSDELSDQMLVSMRVGDIAFSFQIDYPGWRRIVECGIRADVLSAVENIFLGGLSGITLSAFFKFDSFLSQFHLHLHVYQTPGSGFLGCITYRQGGEIDS